MKRIIMKSRRILPLALCASAGMLAMLHCPNVARAEFKAPTPAKNRGALPASVRATVPTGATSLHFGRLLSGPKGEERLVHIWAVLRQAAAKDDGGSDQWLPWLPSPFCVDVFEKGEKAGTWERVASTVYLGEASPTDVEVRWLSPEKKQGPVLVLVTPVYMSTLYTVITFPNVGTDDWDKFGAVQEFSQGGVGGGKITHDFGIDKSGMMTVETTNSFAGKVQSKTVLAWNGREYAEPEAK